MDINLLLNTTNNNIQIIHVQKKDQRFILVPVEISTLPGSQIATIANLSNIIDSGMFALYQKNRLYFNNKVLQEVLGTNPESSKVSNLRAAIIPSNNENDEIQNADFEEMDGEQFINLKLAVAKLKEDAGISLADKTNFDEEKAALSAKFSVKVETAKAKANEVSTSKEKHQLTKNQKQSEKSSFEKEELKQELSLQKERNKLYAEEQAKRKKEAIEKKIEVFQRKQDIGLL